MESLKEKAVQVTAWTLMIGLVGFVIHSGSGQDTSTSTPPAVQASSEVQAAPKVETPAVVDTSPYVEKHGTSDCTDDCSGHDAGYEWADDHDVCDMNYEGSRSDSFNEGVQAYAYDTCYYTDGDDPI